VVTDLNSTTDNYTEQKRGFLSELNSFRPITKTGAGKRFFDYLNSRFGSEKDTNAMITEYDLRYAIAGDYRDRIIIPVYENGWCVNWTARSIYPNSEIRYLSMDNASAAVPIKQTVFNLDCVADHGGVDVLVITEGPFDAMKLDYVGHEYGLAAVSVFNTEISIEQDYLLRKALNYVGRAYVVFDEGFFMEATVASGVLVGSRCTVRPGELPSGYKDFGEMPKEALKKYCKNLTSRLF